MCLKCDLRDKDRRDCLGEQDYSLRREVMMKRLWICLNRSAKVSCPMFCFPSHSLGNAAMGKLCVTLSIFKASLPVESRHRERRDGIWSGFGCYLQHGA